MPIDDYYRSVAQELSATKSQMRDLIPKHWPSDGRHKEAVLRRVLLSRLPSQYVLGEGFVCRRRWTNLQLQGVPSANSTSVPTLDFRLEASTQIDVLLHEGSKPFLFREGELLVSTPDAARAAIEVKTELRSRSALKSAVEKLAALAEFIRLPNATCPVDLACFVGLFVYESLNVPESDILDVVSAAAKGNPNRIIDAIALGSDHLLLYWDGYFRSLPTRPKHWQLYQMKDLAPAYFLGSLLGQVATRDNPASRPPWYPLVEALGKSAIGQPRDFVQESRKARKTRSKNRPGKPAATTPKGI